MPTIAVRHLFDGDRLLSPGELAWDDRGRVVSVRRAKKATRVREALLVPGLVDAHAHLQLPALAHRPTGFVPWIGAVIARRSGMRPADLAVATRSALRELLADGCTAVGEIDSTGTSPRVLADAGFAGRCYQELTGFDLGPVAARARVRERAARRAADCEAGLSPHAPYSVSAALFAAAVQRTRHLCVHAAELPEEQQLLRTGRGPLRDLLESMGRLPVGWRAPRVGAVRWLEQNGVLRRGTLLVHCQHLERGDAARIAHSGAAVVVCPGTMDYFRRESPPVMSWLHAGIPVALGTDSRASNTAMSMRRELAAAAARFRELAPLELLAMATSAGGRAIGCPGLGRLRRGGRADFVLAAAEGAGHEVAIEAFVHGRSALLSTWLRGRRTKGVQSPRSED